MTDLANVAWGVWWGLMAVAVFALSRRRSWAPMLLLPLVAAAAVLLLGGARLSGEAGLEAIAGHGRGTVGGSLSEDPRPIDPDAFSGEQRMLLTLAAEEGAVGDDVPTAMSGEAVILAPASWGASLAVGDKVTIDAEWQLAGTGRTAVIGVEPDLVARASPTGVLARVAAARTAFRDATARLGDESRGLVQGMVIGDRTQMPAQQAADMRTVGLTHLTAVSGTHLSIIAGLLGLALRSVPLRRGARLFGLATGMAAFTALVLPQPSVMRALSMALVGVIAALWGRPAQAMPALAAAVVVLLTCDPHLALEPGMLLSVNAVAGIVLLAPAVRRRLTPLLGPLAAPAVSIPLAAQLACTPLLVVLAPTVSAWTVPANIAAVPFAAPVVALGAVAVCGAALGVPGVSFVVVVLGALSTVIARIAHSLASFPGASLSWPAGWAGAGCAAAVLLGVCLAVAALPRPVRLAGAALACVVALGATHVSAMAGLTVVPEEWSVVSCDVGQGDMTVIRAGESSAVVVDTGPGEGAADCLRALGVDRVPLLVLSHPHADHDGAISEIARVATIDQAWWSAASEGSAGDRARAALQQAGVEAAVPAAGVRVTVGEAAVTVLDTDGAQGHRAAVADDESGVNDQSLALIATSGGVSVLLLGDLEQGAQHALAASIGTLQIDAVKVAHHGSASQDAGLAAQIQATVALVSVGEGNTYGHPTASALALYAEQGAAAIRTDECGTIAVYRDPALHVASACPTPVAG